MLKIMINSDRNGPITLGLQWCPKTAVSAGVSSDQMVH